MSLHNPQKKMGHWTCWPTNWQVAELRVQLSRRLDQAAMEVAASRQAAETATAQALQHHT